MLWVYATAARCGVPREQADQVVMFRQPLPGVSPIRAVSRLPEGWYAVWLLWGGRSGTSLGESVRENLHQRGTAAHAGMGVARKDRSAREVHAAAEIVGTTGRPPALFAGRRPLFDRQQTRLDSVDGPAIGQRAS